MNPGLRVFQNNPVQFERGYCYAKEIMDKLTTQRTEKLAPIIRMLQSNAPDYKAICGMVLSFLGLEELNYALCQRRQDWKAIYESLQPVLNENPNYQRILRILEALDRPGSVDQIADRVDLHRMTIAQTLNALERGGLSFTITFEGNVDGRPTKIYEFPQANLLKTRS